MLSPFFVMVDLNVLAEEQLLHTRLCDLPIGIEGTWLEECVRQLYAELDAQGLVFHPPCYLADEWLTPEGEDRKSTRLNSSH